MKKWKTGRRYKNNRNNKVGILSIMVVMLMILVVVSFQSVDLRAENKVRTKRLEELETSIKQEEERAEEIEELKNYVTTKKYIEEVAKEKLGLVYEDEIIFKSKD